MLLGRPVLEQLGGVVDFGTGKMRILGGQWTNIKRGKQDAMLLKLADNVQNISVICETKMMTTPNPSTYEIF